MNENWTELKIKVPAPQADIAGAIANMVVPYGIYMEDYSHLEEEALEIAHIDLIDEELLQKDREHAIIHIYISPEANPAEAVSFLEERFQAENIPYEIDRDSCVEEDWINNWKKYFHPIPVGEKLLIRPLWEDDYDPQGRTVLHLEPGLAFGTGTHETTGMCVRLVEEHVRPGQKVIDLGTGTGILAIAAAHMGARDVLAIDLDAVAVRVAKENVENNGFAEIIRVQQGDLLDHVDEAADVVVANIIADVIIALCGPVKRHILPGGLFICSGIAREKKGEVVAALEAGGYENLEILDDGEWTAIAANRP